MAEQFDVIVADPPGPHDSPRPPVSSPPRPSTPKEMAEWVRITLTRQTVIGAMAEAIRLDRLFVLSFVEAETAQYLADSQVAFVLRALSAALRGQS
jgi:hypothetical protein